MADAISLTGHNDIVNSVAWNTSHRAQMLATSCKDKKLRLYDPRASPKPIQVPLFLLFLFFFLYCSSLIFLLPFFPYLTGSQECIAHEGVQGFRVIWADSNEFDFLMTVGFSKVTERYATLWDPRKLGVPLHSSLVCIRYFICLLHVNNPKIL